MLRRHLDLPVFDDSIPLRCAQCQARMDPYGDHAVNCSTGFGFTHRHNNVRNFLASHVFRAAGLAAKLEVALLVPGSSIRPADVLVQPPPPLPGELPSLPTAYDVTVRNPYRSAVIRRAARYPGAAADLADADKLRAHSRQLRDVLNLPATAPLPSLGWQFSPVAFDTLGAPSSRTTDILTKHATRISYRTGSSPASVLLRLRQRLSAVIWSSVASAIFVRIPPFQDVGPIS